MRQRQAWKGGGWVRVSKAWASTGTSKVDQDKALDLRRWVRASQQEREMRRLEAESHKQRVVWWGRVCDVPSNRQGECVGVCITRGECVTERTHLLVASGLAILQELDRRTQAQPTNHRGATLGRSHRT